MYEVEMPVRLEREYEGRSRGWQGKVTGWEYSPIEWHFGCALLDLLADTTEDYPLVLPQLNARGASGRMYRLDFAVPAVLLAIELDGRQWHSDKAADHARQKDLEAAGWAFKRFTGREIHRDADQTVRDALWDVDALLAGGSRDGAWWETIEGDLSNCNYYHHQAPVDHDRDLCEAPEFLCAMIGSSPEYYQELLFLG